MIKINQNDPNISEIKSEKKETEKTLNLGEKQS